MFRTEFDGFDTLNNRLEDVRVLLWEVYGSYFDKSTIDPRSREAFIFVSQFKSYSTLIHMAASMLFDLEKEYQTMSSKLWERELQIHELLRDREVSNVKN